MLQPVELPVVQLMPDGTEVTVPLPVLPAPGVETVRVSGISVKVAVTATAAVIETVQVPVPLQVALGDQPVKVEPVDAAAVRTTLWP